jgi:UDP-N-acetylglucosamine 1-carboxyvinyltransferase
MSVEHLGGAIGDRALRVDSTTLQTSEIPDDLMRQMRSSIFLMGPLLGRFGSVTATYPGGCDIGPRPINLHLKGLRALGAVIEEHGGFIHARVDKLTGADITLDYPSVGATENIMMAAVVAEGQTVIRGAAKEPEIVDLAGFLNTAGAQIAGAGTDAVVIDGVPELPGADYEIMPDRIETGTYLIAGAMTTGEIRLLGARAEHLDVVISKLRESGAKIRVLDEGIELSGVARPLAVDVRTMPYPGFPTDLQNQTMAMLLVADGTSIITETVFENRFNVVEEFRRMGAQIQTEGRIAVIRGVSRLTGAQVAARDDLRGGASLVLAGLVAEGQTVVHGIHSIDRGYEALETRLQQLGARVWRRH